MSFPTAIITGASQRLGKATAQLMFARGCNIVLHYHRSNKAATELSRHFNHERKNSCATVSAALENDSAVDKIISTAIQNFGRIDYLINNASAFYPTPLVSALIEQESELSDPQESSAENKLIEFMQINYKAPIQLAKAAHPWLKRSKGAIVNFIDIYAMAGLAEHTSYVTAKSALLAASQDLARSFAPEVNVNCISPGAILWPDHQPKTQPAQQKQDEIIANSALKRLGKVEEIAATVAFLAMDAKYVTGQNINVDGGRRLFI